MGTAVPGKPIRTYWLIVSQDYVFSVTLVTVWCAGCNRPVSGTRRWEGNVLLAEQNGPRRVNHYPDRARIINRLRPNVLLAEQNSKLLSVLRVVTSQLQGRGLSRGKDSRQLRIVKREILFSSSSMLMRENSRRAILE